jgi:ribonuclease HI
VYTDSRTTLDSLHNPDIHTSLIEEIRQKVNEMENSGWKIWFRWIKAHVGNSGNELADRLAKEASDKTDIPISYNRVQYQKVSLKRTSRTTAWSPGRGNGTQHKKGEQQKNTSRK